MIPAAIGDCDLTGKGEEGTVLMGVGCRNDDADRSHETPLRL